MQAIRYCDPFYWWVRHVVLRRFADKILSDEQKEFVDENVGKHEGIFWICILLMPFGVWGMQEVHGNSLLLVGAILAGAIVGLLCGLINSWFNISFAGIPEKLNDNGVGLSVTFWMFLALQISLMMEMTVIARVAPWQVWIPLSVLVYALEFACISYDTADGFKPGLDDRHLQVLNLWVDFLQGKGQRLAEEPQPPDESAQATRTSR